MQNPKHRPSVAMVLLICKLSGNKSMHETTIIAPAAKHKRNGRIDDITPVQKNPTTAKTGSTTPDKKAHKKLFCFENPTL